MKSEEGNKGPVAIIGMALRYAGAQTVDQYWSNICNNVDALHSATDEEILDAGIDAGRLGDRAYVRPAAFIPNTADFDAPLFGFSARDAEIVDPQQRVFLECAWEAFEDAGYDPTGSGKDVGVFAGCGANSYRKQNLDPNMGTGAMLATMVGNDKDFLATRVAYKLNLTGPAVVVQSACSTSLVATQMAFESLRRGECSMALAGGVSISFPQNTGYVYEPGMILSPDGRCRAFDAKAAGTAIGRGAGAVLLKPLAAAVRDRDHIYAVIHGAAINNDGANKVGYTAPSVEGQADVIRKSMRVAGFAPSTVRYVEAHGTGTEVGDSIEIAALARAFGEDLPKGSCTVSSVKPNVGHTDTAAGVSGLIKAALAMKHRMLPGTVYFERPNPELSLGQTPFKVTSKMEPYTGNAAFRGGVSAFGIGGTNAHVSLEEWRVDPKHKGGLADSAATNGHDSHLTERPRSLMFPLSGNSEAALAKQRENLAIHLENKPQDSLEDIAFTLQTGRKLLPHRSFLIAQDRDELRSALGSTQVLKNQVAVTTDSRTPEVYFLFPGQGAQYVNMGRGLYESDERFRKTIDYCCDVLQPLLGVDLRTIMYPEAGGEAEAAERLKETAITQPAVLVIEYALAERVLHAGVVPTAMLGHSLGEYVAACIAGVITLDEALHLVAERGRLVQTVPRGSMLAVSLTEEELLKRLPPEICIAALNAPKQTIVSGPTDAIQSFAATLATQRIACQSLPTSHAFHSSMLDPIVGTTRDSVARLNLRPPKIPFISNLTGTWITAEEATSPDYWAAHLRHAVRFSDGLTLLTRKGSGVLIEVGPGETLLALARNATKGIKGIRTVATTPRPTASVTAEAHWMLAVGQLWMAGVKLNWHNVHGDRAPGRVSLPTYPFERQRYWIDHSPKKKAGEASEISGPLKKRPDMASWLYTRSWQSSVPAPATAIDDSAKHWLVFKDPAFEASNALVQGLASGTAIVTVVVPGKQFARISPNAYAIDAGNAEHHAALLEDLRKARAFPTNILYVAKRGGKEDVPQTGFQQLFHLVRALEHASQAAPHKLALFVVTDKAFDVLQEGRSVPSSTAVASLADVVGLEMRGVTTRVVDCDFEAAGAVAPLLLKELASAGDIPLVAYRGRTRWLPSFISLPISLPTGSSKSILRGGGTYIVAGGTGGIGLVLAQYLARTVSAHLVLVGRKAFAPAADWESIAADDAAPAADRQKAQAMIAMQLLGGSVEVQSADSSDLVRMREIVAAARARDGGLAGIIHAAGIAGPTLIGSTTAETIDQMFAAKGAGTAWIEEVLSSRDLDFVLLCSSASALVPSVGLSAYGAANAYLDGFAAAHDDPQGTRVIAANWDNWSEAGMAADAEATMQSMHLRSLSEFGITNREAEQVFERVLHSPVSQVAVTTRHLPAWVENVRTMYRDLDTAQGGDAEKVPTESEASGAHHPRPELSQDYAAPTTDTERAVVEIWQELLGLDLIGIHDDFFELGGHSLLGTQVIARVRDQFKVDFPLRLIFEATTPEKFARLLETLPRATETESTPTKPDSERVEIEI